MPLSVAVKSKILVESGEVVPIPIPTYACIEGLN
jgi:hypothetical protein